MKRSAFLILLFVCAVSCFAGSAFSTLYFRSEIALANTKRVEKEQNIVEKGIFFLLESGTLMTQSIMLGETPNTNDTHIMNTRILIGQENNAPFIGIIDKSGGVRLLLGLDEETQDPYIEMKDEDGNLIWQAP